MEHWSHYFSAKEWACLSDELQEEPRWKFLCSYNEGVYITNGVMLHLPSHSLNTLMTIWIPMNLLLYMTLHILYMSFGHPLYNTFWIGIYIIHKSDAAYGDSWHDMTWHRWHGQHDDMEMSSHSCCLLFCFFLRTFLFRPPYGLEMRSLQWYHILSSGCKLSSLCFLLIDLLAYSATKVSNCISPFSISFYIIWSWCDRVLAYKIHSWQDDISLINP